MKIIKIPIRAEITIKIGALTRLSAVHIKQINAIIILTLSFKLYFAIVYAAANKKMRKLHGQQLMHLISDPAAAAFDKVM